MKIHLILITFPIIQVLGWYSTLFSIEELLGKYEVKESDSEGRRQVDIKQ